MNVSRAFSGEREEDISRVFMLFRIVGELGVVGNLSSLRVARLVTGTGGGEDEVTKHRAVWFVEKSNQYIRAFAGSNFWARTFLRVLIFQFWGRRSPQLVFIRHCKGVIPVPG